MVNLYHSWQRNWLCRYSLEESPDIWRVKPFNDIVMISFFFSLNQSVRIFLVLLYTGCIAALSLLPPQDFPSVPLFEGADKIVHFFMYFIFSFLLCWALKIESKFQRWVLVLPIGIGWGIFMEYTQLSMHMGRSFSWYDVMANSFGVMVGIVFYRYALMLRATEKSSKSWLT